MRIVECGQKTPEWWAVRRGVPTASAFDRILTPTGKLSSQAEGYACQLIAETFDTFYGQGPEYQSVDMQNGIRLEPRARRFYEFARDCEVREVGFCFHDSERFGCSPDGLVGEDGCLELKSPKPQTHIQYLIAGGLPKDYKPQCHGHLIVTGRAWCDFVSYVPGFPPHMVRVEADEYTGALRVALHDFCELYAKLLATVMQRREEAMYAAPVQDNPVPMRSFCA